MTNFIWEKFDNPKLIELKSLCHLEEIILNSDDEFEQQIALNNWVFNKLPSGGEYKDYSDLSSFEILKDLEKGMHFRCTQQTQLLIQCSTALGWYVRKLGVDSDHEATEPDMHHGVCDIWSSKFKKWFVLDPMNNLYYVKDEIPLNSLEIRSEYIKNFALEVKGIRQNSNNTIYNKYSKGFDTPSNYFWFYISQRNNFFEKPGLFNTYTYLWVDEYNKNKKWHKNGKLHDMYNGRFIEVNDENKIFPKL